MKIASLKYISLLSLSGIASGFDAATSYTVTTDSSTQYITLTPKAPNTHDKTLLFLHGGGGSAAGTYSYI